MVAAASTAPLALVICRISKVRAAHYILTTWEKWQKEGKSCSKHLIPQTQSYPAHSPPVPHFRENPATLSAVSEEAAEGAGRRGSCLRVQVQLQHRHHVPEALL